MFIRKPREGWGPLCAFLGKEEPEVPFPKLNERGALAERSKEVQKASLKYILRNLDSAVVSLGVSVFAVSWARRQFFLEQRAYRFSKVTWTGTTTCFNLLAQPTEIEE